MTSELQADGLQWAEGLIVQLPDTHDGRNSWLLNYGLSAEADRQRKIYNERMTEAQNPRRATRPQGAPAPVRAVETSDSLLIEYMFTLYEGNGSRDTDAMWDAMSTDHQHLARIFDKGLSASLDVPTDTRRVASGEDAQHIAQHLSLWRRRASTSRTWDRGEEVDLLGALLDKLDAALSASPARAQAASAGEPAGCSICFGGGYGLDGKPCPFGCRPAPTDGRSEKPNDVVAAYREVTLDLIKAVRRLVAATEVVADSANIGVLDDHIAYVTAVANHIESAAFTDIAEYVSKESALQAIDHLEQHNGPGRRSEAVAMLRAAR